MLFLWMKDFCVQMSILCIGTFTQVKNLSTSFTTDCSPNNPMWSLVPKIATVKETSVTEPHQLKKNDQFVFNAIVNKIVSIVS